MLSFSGALSRGFGTGVLRFLRHLVTRPRNRYQARGWRVQLFSSVPGVLLSKSASRGPLGTWLSRRSGEAVSGDTGFLASERELAAPRGLDALRQRELPQQ